MNQATSPEPAPFRLSIVVPMYNEADVIPVFFDRVLPIVEAVTVDYEIVCVNDGSSDGTLRLLEAARGANHRIKILDLTRNFGKEVALSAGIDHAGGDAVIPIDADLQDPPELIPDMVEQWRAGYEVVLAVRRDRSRDTFARRSSAVLFHRVMGRLSEVPIPADAGDFRLLDRQAVEMLKQLPERTRFMKGIFAWLGFRPATIEYARPARASGTSKWRPWQLWNFALEGLFSFTTLPLRIWTYFGVAVAFAALAYMVFIILRTLVLGVDVPGYASLIVFLLFFSGMNMIGLGIMGEYLGRIFIEVKGRPLYLVRQAIGFEEARPEEFPGDAVSARSGRAPAPGPR
ncbi:MAG TPA: glycosyltransferase family 2 protein [Gemmatimonadota bacterium]|nr:glycosyltransferase family 2 protein [Gemmatimonadota bacterium]